MREVAIQTQRLSKRYGEASEGAWAVYDVSLSIFAGEVTVLMGPSGSGKTTLLSMFGCILAPSAGELALLGGSLQGFDEERRQQFRRENMGFIFQSYNLISALNAEQNVRLALRLRGCDEDSARELLEYVGLDGKADKYPAQMSGGERQRVAIARALAGNPALLLADEPTAALDAGHGRRVMKLLQRRARESGTTVVVVTHDPRVLEHADRVIELEDGMITRIYRLVRKPRVTQTCVR